ncbi:MAG: polysaccharide pyruvyl transferase family protein [Planctomycetota bacterium]
MIADSAETPSEPLPYISLPDVLEPFRGGRAHFVSPPGNNGDHLIYLGTLEACRRGEIELVRRASSADVIFLNGGATMTDFWPAGFRRLDQYSRRFPNKPFVVMPNSFLFDKTDLAGILGQRKGRTILLARERQSAQRLADVTLPDGCEPRLSDDAALELHGSEIVEKYKREGSEKHVLVVDRQDREASSDVAFEPAGYQRQVMTPLKLWRHRLRPWLRVKSNPNRAAKAELAGLGIMPVTDRTHRLLQPAFDDQPAWRDLPIINADVSDCGLFRFDTFCQMIADAAVVVSTRLHAGIFAALLGKPTYLVPQKYGKIDGIYNLSMSHMPNVRLVSDAGQPESTT